METLWLCGPCGVGKTATGWELWSRLVAAGVPAGYADIDQLGMCYPERPEDPGRFHLQARNLAAVIAGHRAAGARCVVVSGCVDARHGVRRDDLPGLDLTVCLLSATGDELTRRFVGRQGTDAGLDVQLREAATLSAATFPDVVVDTTGRTVPEVAAEIRRRTGWPRLTGTPAGDTLPAAAADPGGRVLWVSGATCTGKSSAAFPVFLRLVQDGTPAAYVDLEQLGTVAHEIRARVLAAMWANYRRAGARALVLSGPVADDATARLYAEALPGAEVILRRLHAGPGTLTGRILRRGRGEGTWHQPGDPLLGRPCV